MVRCITMAHPYPYLCPDLNPNLNPDPNPTLAVSATGYYQDSLELRQQAIDATVSGFFYAIELCLG